MAVQYDQDQADAGYANAVHADADHPFDAVGPTLSDVGEEALLAHLREIARPTLGRDIVLGSGDDAAVWRPPAGRDVVASQDALVELCDFRRDWLTPRGLGRRALVAALSDLAGMGARPAYCLMTVCAPPTTRYHDIVSIQAGLCGAAVEFGCAVAGGDVSAIDGPLVIDVAVTGTIGRDRGLRRDRAQVGDVVVVTGVLGRAAAGLALLMGDARAADVAAAPAGAAVSAQWRAAQISPSCRLAVAGDLVAAGVRCAGDVSDGVMIDTVRTAAESGVAIELWRDALPVDTALARAFPEAWTQFALAGGEEFELLWTAPRRVVDAVRSSWPWPDLPLTVIGTVGTGRGVRLLDRQNGTELSPPRPLTRHFA